jgi:hypothetical protein
MGWLGSIQAGRIAGVKSLATQLVPIANTSGTSRSSQHTREPDAEPVRISNREVSQTVIAIGNRNDDPPSGYRSFATNSMGSAVDIGSRAMLKKHGLEDKRDYTVVEAPFPTMKAMLAQKKADLGTFVPPFAFDPELAQIAKMANYALFIGIMRNSSMAEEIVLTLIGLGVFSVGRALERKAV